MKGDMNPKVVGSVLIGFALVGGAFVLSDFGTPQVEAPSPQAAATRQANDFQRTPITVSDQDGNGIEDWRDQFVTTEPIVIDRQAAEDYVPPDTVTGQMSLGFFENLVRARGNGSFGASDEAVIAQTVDTLGQVTAHELYDTPDVIVLEEWDEEDIVNYANTMAQNIIDNDRPEIEWELRILNEIVRNQQVERIDELEVLVEAYRQNRDDALNTPVPRIFLKEHLDLINTFHAIHEDIDAMTLSIEDPAYSLLRLKRYEDDAKGLGYAMANMFEALVEYAEYFETNDPALLFVIFSSEFQT